MSKIILYYLIGCITISLIVGSAVSFIFPRPTVPEAWVVYKDANMNPVYDGLAIAQKIIREPNLNIGGVSSGNNYASISLSHYDNATSRSDLIKYVDKIRKGLPKDCPIKISVETLDDAIKDRQETIDIYLGEIEDLERIHGTPEAKPQ